MLLESKKARQIKFARKPVLIDIAPYKTADFEETINHIFIRPGRIVAASWCSSYLELQRLTRYWGLAI